MTPPTINEAAVENAALGYLKSLGYECLYGPDISPGGEMPKRAGYREVFLEETFQAALERINPKIPGECLKEASSKLLHSAVPELYEDNRLFHQMLVEGVDVEYPRKDGSMQGDKVWALDFTDPANNLFYAVNQFRVHDQPPGHAGKEYSHRPDIIIFVNGIPLAVMELKNIGDPGHTLHKAYDQLSTYKRQIPALFRSNALLVISDGAFAKAGSLTAKQERFMPWRTVDGKSVAPRGKLELETLLKGLFSREVFLDVLQNFSVFTKENTHVVKKVAAYHQYHAVTTAVRCTLKAAAQEGDRRVGVIWHTQGSGKSLSMLLYAAKMIREKAMDNPTLLVLTDRNDLDEQLFNTFAASQELLRQSPRQALGRGHLRELLNVASGGVVFTTIQKFSSEERRQEYPLLSKRRNIVVIADEAHRSQYDFIDGFARNIREGLPNASFIGFTGTPIALSDRDTYAVFGNNIHTYDIQQAVEDGSTVRIYYESRLAKLELDEKEKPYIDQNFEELTEGEESSRKEKLKDTWARMEALVGSQKRLELIAKDIVTHFEQRSAAMEGKAMIVAMSRRICVELYDLLVRLRPEWHSTDDTKGALKIIMTGSASDPQAFQPHHRTKSAREKLARRFKDPNDPLKLVIVRDMWLTGFDAPCLHTMYVDKPMQGHGLMQAIARVNRVFKDKPGGLIVDHIGLADKLKLSLENYSKRDREQTGVPQEQAIRLMLEKSQLIENLLHGFGDHSAGFEGSPQEQLEMMKALADYILSRSQEDKAEGGLYKQFMQASLELLKAFALCAASDEARKLRPKAAFFQGLRGLLAKCADDNTEGNSGYEGSRIELNTALRQLVSKAVSSTDIIDIFSEVGLKKPNISIFSEEFMAEVRNTKFKNLALEMLKKLLRGEIKLRSKNNVVQERRFTEMLQSSIRKYVNRQITIAEVIEEVFGIAEDLKKAAHKGEELGLSQDEHAFYDALAENKSALEVLGDEKLCFIARELTKTIHSSVSIDWAVKESARAKIRIEVKNILRKFGYPPDLEKKAVETVIEQAEKVCESVVG